MKLKTLMTVMALALLTVAVAGAQPFNPAAGVGGTGVVDTPEGGAVVLWDQNTVASTNGAPDQNFEAAYEAYSSSGADDFDVDFPDGWDIETVSIVGSLLVGGVPVVGPLDGASINFYPDNGVGGPDTGTTLCSYANIPVVDDTNGNYVADLPAPCSLPMGIHWVEVQTDVDFLVVGQHFWSNNTSLVLGEAHWSNPGDGFGTGCTTLQPISTCVGTGPIGGGNPSFNFQLIGALGVPDVPTVEVPTLGQYGALALIALLGLGGFIFLRRRG